MSRCYLYLDLVTTSQVVASMFCCLRGSWVSGERLGLWGVETEIERWFLELGFNAKFNQNHKDPQFHLLATPPIDPNGLVWSCINPPGRLAALLLDSAPAFTQFPFLLISGYADPACSSPPFPVPNCWQGVIPVESCPYVFLASEN